MEGDNWEDLFAVVKGSLSSSNSPTSSLTRDLPSLRLPPPLYNYQPLDLDLLPFFHDTTTALRELEELCKPFLPVPQPPPLLHAQPLPSCSPFSSPQSFFSHHHQAPPRSKRRKNQQKRVVCQVPADGLSSDVWAWRKYGQKPIKGSPFPRGYYRCSSSKGCPARKQLERSRKDPNMFVVTYTAEHNHPVPTHRNSLAGSTRQRSSSSISVSRFLSKKGLIGGGGSGKGGSSSGSEVTNEEKKGGEAEEEGVVMMREMLGEKGEDMVFLGLEEIEEAMGGFPACRGEAETEI